MEFNFAKGNIICDRDTQRVQGQKRLETPALKKQGISYSKEPRS